MDWNADWENVTALTADMAAAGYKPYDTTPDTCYPKTCRSVKTYLTPRKNGFYGDNSTGHTAVHVHSFVTAAGLQYVGFLYREHNISEACATLKTGEECALRCQRGYDGFDVNVICLNTGDVALGKDGHDLYFPSCTPRKCVHWDPPWPKWTYMSTPFSDIDWASYEAHKSLGVNYELACEGTRYRENSLPRKSI